MQAVKVLEKQVAEEIQVNHGVYIIKGNGKRAKQQRKHFSELAKKRMDEMRVTQNSGLSREGAKQMSFVNNRVKSDEEALVELQRIQRLMGRDLHFTEAVRIIKGFVEDTHSFEVFTETSTGVSSLVVNEKEKTEA